MEDGGLTEMKEHEAKRNTSHESIREIGCSRCLFAFSRPAEQNVRSPVLFSHCFEC